MTHRYVVKARFAKHGNVLDGDAAHDLNGRRQVEPSHRYRQSVRENGGAVNPYTFVPTPPRGDLTDGPGETGLGDAGDAGAPSHALVGPSGWTGTLRVRLTTLTPLLLLDDGTRQDRLGRRCHDVRLDEHRRPLLHGASLKGALRSAFETVTASRYGVFGPHPTPLAYRLTTDHATAVRPAVVIRSDGRLVFRLCGTDDGWNHPQGVAGPIQPSALLTCYDGVRKSARPGKQPIATPRPRNDVTNGDPAELLHGRPVYARLRLYRMGSNSQNLVTTWVVTDLVDPGRRDTLTPPAASDPAGWGPSLKIVKGRDGAPIPAIARLGIVCATGHSIDTKKHERFFPLHPPFTDLPLKDRHQAMWDAVLEAYRDAARYNRVDTAAKGRTAGTGLERSWHVRHPDAARTLDHRTPVWVELSADGSDVIGVHPVMIGRKPFAESPDALLPPSLHPAGHEQGPARLSPADRLFGWTPDGAKNDHEPSGDRRAEASVGYRGRLSVADVRCDAARIDEWEARGSAFQRSRRDRGVILSPLSTPKPTQFRFYSAADDHGDPWPDGVPKQDGYSEGSGLRGRKMYRWRKEPASYWEPDDECRRDSPRASAVPRREYLALEKIEPTQTIRVTDWVRPGVTFTAELRLDAVPSAELGALVWLLRQGETAPLRLGHGKPLGFGVVRAEILWGDDGSGTRLWNGDAAAARWRSLDASAPAPRADIEALSALFESISHPLLRQAREDYLIAAAATAHPVRYPHSTSAPKPETFTWFVDNERLKDEAPVTGWALPHVTSPEQRLPHFPPRKQDGRPGTRATRHGR
jgi:CRISPR-associated protein (TIGR03986 family)